ncbi:MAG TPA: hypothetical protein VE820_07660 [Sphingomicrobium sp.]|nr:hypothetical protein [Sphingomicrobium sp.]
MRKYLVPIVAAASTLAIAVPGSAQAWAPPVYNYQPYNYGRGFIARDFSHSMQGRVERIRRDIRQMEYRRILSPREAQSLEWQASNLQGRIYRASRNGIQPWEAQRLENQIRRLEYRVSREATDWNRRPGYGHY